jgi:hypothetical protein
MYTKKTRWVLNDAYKTKGGMEESLGEKGMSTLAEREQAEVLEWSA